jgi:rhodanese-related sulfurtransferase
MYPVNLVTRLFFAIGLLAASLALAHDHGPADVASIAVNDAKELVADDADAIILDVRMPIEFETSHISGSVNVDVQNEDFKEMAATLDPDKTYIVHCTKNPVGGRSGRALETLQELGFKNLYSLEGGYIAWKEADLPLTEVSN